MKYRKFGQLDWEASVLGFGIMRLPVIDEDMAKINEPEAIRMVRRAIDGGVNYLDSAYLYHGGNSEQLVGKVLKDGYRDKVRIATKLPVRFIDKKEDFDRILNEQLTRLDIDYIDFYLLHSLNKEFWHKVRDWGVLQWAEKQMAAGKFGRLGFSFHDDFDAFKEIVDAYDNWVLAQVLYNYMDVDEQAGRKGVEYAAGKGLPVVIMEPLRGGLLTKDPLPDVVAEIWARAEKQLRPVDWALRWLWDQPEVTLVLSGMSTMEQVEEDLELADRAEAGVLTEAERKLYAEVRKAYRGFRPIKCTACRYCVPCPNNVDIPKIFEIYENSVMYRDTRIGKMLYNVDFGINLDQRADKCTECGECLEKCPQNIQIPDWLKKVHSELYLENPPGPPHSRAPAEKKD